VLYHEIYPFIYLSSQRQWLGKRERDDDDDDDERAARGRDVEEMMIS